MDAADRVIIAEVEQLPLERVVEPVAGFEALGRAELHELSCGEVNRVMRQAPDGLHGEALLAACLRIDGAPLGLERLQALPGRFFFAVRRAVDRCGVLHGFGVATAAAEASPATAEEPTQGEA
jgi:hypothetical protein